MTEYLTAVDIANRALQHCGATRINPALGLTENSRNASEIGFCYGKLRRAELRRNVWRFATRRSVIRSIDTTTMLLVPALWVPDTTYFVGSITADATGNIWISRIANNVGADPQNTLAWEPYFGPLTVSLFSATAYFAGELVYTAPGDGTNRVYLSLQNGNSDVPDVGTVYNPAATYSKNQVVTLLGQAYMSLIDLNAGNLPSSAPGSWNIATSYLVGNRVSGSDGVIYQSLIYPNIGHDPTTDGGVNWFSTGVLTPWTTTFVGGAGSGKWLLIGGAEFPSGVTLKPVNVVYPLGAGLSAQSVSGNVFRLPSGFLREAPQNPKAGAHSWLGGPTGLAYNDWSFEGDFLVSSEGGPIAFRFVADVTDVTGMDDMFCEGLAARVALEVCETLTQSTAKLGTIAKIYDEWMSTARTVNGIETGSDEPPEDDYVTVRF